MNFMSKDYNWIINIHLGIKYKHAGFKNYLEKYSASFASLDFRRSLWVIIYNWFLILQDSEMVYAHLRACMNLQQVNIVIFTEPETKSSSSQEEMMSVSRWGVTQMAAAGVSCVLPSCPCTTHPWSHSPLGWCPGTSTHDLTAFAQFSLTN